MFDHRGVVVSKRVLAGATLAALGLTGSMLFASSATADTGPNSSECINAKTVLSNAQTAQAAAQAAYNQAIKNRDTALDAYNAALADASPANDATALAALNAAKDQLLTTKLILDERVKAVAAAQGVVNTACAEVTPTTTPTVTTAPPPPAQGVFYTTCAQALAAVGHPLREGVDPGYRLALDRDQDGLACEAVEGNPPARVVHYANCTIALDAVGHTLIEGRDPGYRIGLDRDQDGIACEANEGPAPAAAILTCQQLKDRGIALPIARGTQWYRGYLDANHNGFACEIVENPPVVNNTTINNPPPTNTTIVNPPAAQGPTNVYVVPPAPSGPGFSQIQQPPAGAVQTGDGSSLLR